MNILLPYGGRAVWKELQYCLRSIDKYIPEANVTIYSDTPVDWLQNVEFVEMNRFRKDAPMENFWDTVWKIQYYANHHSGDFLYVYDDQIFLREFHPIMFFNVALQSIEPGDAEQRKDKHGRTINKAVEMLNSVGVKLWNHETHCPRILNCEKIQLLYDAFDILNQDFPPAISTLYYNYFYEVPNQVLADKNNLRASFCFEDSPVDGCYMAVNSGEIADACRDKYILHYNDKGLNFSPWGIPILQNFISNLFPDKCRFEK